MKGYLRQPFIVKRTDGIETIKVVINTIFVRPTNDGVELFKQAEQATIGLLIRNERLKPSHDQEELYVLSSCGLIVI
ncbi:hypothetical protein DGG96_01290 [Legionella qingyii]|uniref:Uncharacterized protein n=1 Tax=Legionella qingyii TaxID=2184757 RepID=A0A317U857_9GAMM|nr:hypothetical protein DGG96_01290 [Legionella qingyii]